MRPVLDLPPIQLPEAMVRRPLHILRVQADQLSAVEEVSEPILRLADWYEEVVLGERLNAVARRGEPTYLVFDEIQNLDNWAPQLKSLVDHSVTRALVTGSSALRIEKGRDSLAGRMTTIEAGVLSLTEIAAFRGLDVGGPFLADNGLQALIQQKFWEQLREHGRAIAATRDEVFRCFSERGGYPLAHYGADPIWCQQEKVPLDPERLAQAPHLQAAAVQRARSVLHAMISTLSCLDILRSPNPRQPQVDFVLTIGTRRIPVEVKYQKKIDPLRDTGGLRTFLEKAANNAPFGLLITQTDIDAVVDPRIVALPLATVMLLR
jgi:predicted AAA+ superfamily ATPase